MTKNFAKKILAILFIQILPAFVFSIDVDDIVKKAMQTSVDYKQGKLSLASIRANIYSLKLDKKPSFSIGLSNAKSSLDKDNYFSGEAFANYTSAPDDPLEIRAKLRTALSDENSSLVTDLTPSLAISKTYDLSGVKSISSELSLQKSHKVAIANEMAYDYKFTKNVYQAILSCISSHSSFIKAQNNYDKLKEEYNADISIGTFTEGTLTHSQRKKSLLAAEVALESAKASYVNSKNNFKKTTGFDYKELEPEELYTFSQLDEALEFEFAINPEGNIDCISKKYDMQIAKNKYDRVKKGGEQLKSEISASYDTSLNSSSPEKKIDADAHITLSSSLYDIKIGGGIGYDINDKIKPSVDFSLTLSPDKTYKKDYVERQQKGIDYQKVALDYSLAVSDYYNSAIDTQYRLINNKNAYISAQAAFEYAKMQYKNSKELMELGYKSVSDIAQDRIDYIDAKNTYQKSILEFIIDVLDAKILNL